MIEEFQEDVCGCEYAVTEAKAVSHALCLIHDPFLFISAFSFLSAKQNV